MNARAITAYPILRPTFDNRHVDVFALWFLDNVIPLGKYAMALGFNVTSDDRELDRWMRTQHDIDILKSTAAPSSRGDSAPGSKTTVETGRASRLPHTTDAV